MKSKNISKVLYLILISFLYLLTFSACRKLATIEVVEEPAHTESTRANQESGALETEPTTTEEPRPDFNLVMVPVVPFYTYNDEIIFDDIKKYWNGDTQSLNYLSNTNEIPELLLNEKNFEILKKVLGEPASVVPIKLLEGEELQKYSETNPNIWSIIPFEDLNVRWKVLNFPEISIFDKKLDISKYPLTITLSFEEAKEIYPEITPEMDKSKLTNREIDYLTSLNMTGVTAMAVGRHIANRMDEKGVLYPAEKIVDTLKDADITHISNEIPFVEGCQGEKKASLIFCSRPEYMELLKYVGTDVVELTGNHMNDYGHEALLKSLAMYEKEGLPYFGGGKNLEDSYKPAIIESNGNRIAFLGFNYWGPASDWATKDTPGSTPPNFEDLEAIIRDLKSQGYIVIFTFQYVETYSYKPTQQQIIDFRRMANAGADIVSGSQSHQPVGVEITDSSFINYGLGNLFFSQIMDNIAVRQGIIAKHIFYKGKHINTMLITTMLEDYCQPRLTTSEERLQLLKSVFENSVR
ncbi:MAG: CapA family protein [Actinobacteria bacterium]|nr:CapA family protein [Actinomycetota bacterium]